MLYRKGKHSGGERRRQMSRGESFDLTLAKACAKAFATACEVGFVVSDATGEVSMKAAWAVRPAGCAGQRAAGPTTVSRPISTE